MTHRQRILADKLIGAPLEFCFNYLARLLGYVLRRDHSVSNTNVHRIIVAKLVGMGSIIQATPLLRALKQTYPQSKITFVTLKGNRELVCRLDGVDDVVCLDDSSILRMSVSIFRALNTLIRQRADIYFDLELYSAFASLMALCAITRNRVGFYRRSTSLKNGIYTHLVYFNARMPIRQLYLQLGRVTGAVHLGDEFIGPIRLGADDSSALATKLSAIENFKPDRPYIVINPNASDLMLERRWPVANVVATVEALSTLGYSLMFIGAPAEREYVESVLAQLPSAISQNVINTAGRLSLPQLFALLKNADCMLTNDTGPMHMAIALNCPTVCLFGPVHPDHYGHVSQNVRTLYAPVFCSPCVHEIEDPPCNGNNVCMQRLTPEMAIEAVKELLELKNAPPTTESTSIRLPLCMDDLHDRPLGLVIRASMRQPT